MLGTKRVRGSHRGTSAVVSTLGTLSGYGIAAAAVSAAVGVRLALDPILGTHFPYLPFALAVLVAARFGGRLPGLAATALSVAWFFIEPRNSLAIANPAAAEGLALFLVVGPLISLLVGQLRRSFLTTSRGEEVLRQALADRDLALKAANLGTWNYRFDSGDVLWDERSWQMFGLTLDDRIDYPMLYP